DVAGLCSSRHFLQEQYLQGVTPEVRWSAGVELVVSVSHDQRRRENAGSPEAEAGRPGPPASGSGSEGPCSMGRRRLRATAKRLPASTSWSKRLSRRRMAASCSATTASGAAPM